MSKPLAAIIASFAIAISANAQNFDGLVNIKEIDSTMAVDLMYAKEDNFVGEKMYGFTEAYLHPKAAEALAKANSIIKEKRPGWRICIYDAARPMSVQRKMWNKVKGTTQQNYVSNPANGGGLHNYGLAADVSIVDENGDSITMGTKVDALTKLSHIDNEEKLVEQGKMTRESMENRRLLRSAMEDAGFHAIRTEWWHFNYTTRSDARKNYKVIE